MYTALLFPLLCKTLGKVAYTLCFYFLTTHSLFNPLQSDFSVNWSKIINDL